MVVMAVQVVMPQHHPISAGVMLEQVEDQPMAHSLVALVGPVFKAAVVVVAALLRQQVPQELVVLVAMDIVSLSQRTKVLYAIRNG
jgi:hypothetical protein